MKLYRVSKLNFIKDLSGEGARLYGGRWNKQGDALLYFSEHLSLCVLELLTRVDFEFLKNDYTYLEIEIPETFITTLKHPERISKQWRSNPPNNETQRYGSNWIESNKSLGLRVPSAVLPVTFNCLINPKHPDFNKLKIIKVGSLDLDSRLV